MKRSIFTNNDIKEIIKNAFKAHTEEIVLIEENGSQSKADLYDYLNIDFYVWKNRVVSADGELTGYQEWVQSLNYSLNKAYALIETTDADVVASQDIDSASVTGRITFFIQSNKISNLDYFVMKVRNAYLGNVQELQNSYGDILNAYINIGVLLYDEEPESVQIGESMQVSLNFTLSYLTKALNYNDTKAYLLLSDNRVPALNKDLYVNNSVVGKLSPTPYEEGQGFSQEIIVGGGRPTEAFLFPVWYEITAPMYLWSIQKIVNKLYFEVGVMTSHIKLRFDTYILKPDNTKIPLSNETTTYYNLLEDEPTLCTWETKYDLADKNIMLEAGDWLVQGIYVTTEDADETTQENLYFDSTHDYQSKIFFYIDDPRYKELPYIKGSYQNIFLGQINTNQNNPNRTGIVNTNVGQTNGISFYDFDKDLTLQLNDLFWSIGAYYIDGELQTEQPVNIPVWLKIYSHGHFYTYKDVITEMKKDIANSDFNISQIILKGYAKV